MAILKSIIILYTRLRGKHAFDRQLPGVMTNDLCQVSRGRRRSDGTIDGVFLVPDLRRPFRFSRIKLKNNWLKFFSSERKKYRYFYRQFPAISIWNSPLFKLPILMSPTQTRTSVKASQVLAPEKPYCCTRLWKSMTSTCK